MPLQVHLDHIHPLKRKTHYQVIEALKRYGLESGGARCTVEEATEAVVTRMLILRDPERCRAGRARDSDLSQGDVFTALIARDVPAQAQELSFAWLDSHYASLCSNAA